MTIRLSPLPRADVARVQHLVLPPHQADFVGTIAEMSADPDPLQDFHQGEAGEEVVAFFKTDRDFSRRVSWLPAGALGFRGLLVGGQYQGRGLGRALLAALPGYLAARYPGAAEVWLSVDAGNTLAAAAYTKAGWQAHPERFMGRVGEEIVMRLPCQASPATS